MVVLEPSCCAVFRDKMHSWFHDSKQAGWLKENTFTFSEFLDKKLPGYQPPKVQRKAMVQGHCHHKAIMRFKEEETLMSKMGLDAEVLDSGCCGMAGSFGYEKISMRSQSRAANVYCCLKFERLGCRRSSWRTD